MTRLPCLRYKITESSLYRTTFQQFEFFRLHLMVGPTYGDFHIKRQWRQSETKILEFAQDSNVILKLRVREFMPTAEELLSDDARGNKMFSIPWAIADPDEATSAVNLYIDRCIEPYIYAILDDSNHLVWDVFGWARRLSVFPEPVSLSLSLSITDGRYCSSDISEHTPIQRDSHLGDMSIPGGPLAVLGRGHSRCRGPLAPLRQGSHHSSATVHQLPDGRHLHGANPAATAPHDPEAAPGHDSSQQDKQLVRNFLERFHPAPQLRAAVPVP